MNEKSYSILVNGDTIAATCLKPCARCMLDDIFVALDNVKITNTVTTDGIRVCGLRLSGTNAEIERLKPMVVNIVQQKCDWCQKQR